MKWVANAIITLGAISLLAAGICLTVEDRTGSAATALSFGFLLVVMLLLAKFRRFKGFGFEAEMWEEKQAEAENLIERLKAISKAMVQQMAAYSANMGLVNLGATITVPHFEENPSVPMKMRHRPTRSLDLRALKDDLANADARYSKEAIRRLALPGMEAAGRRW